MVWVDGHSSGARYRRAACMDSAASAQAAFARCVQAVRVASGGHEIRRVWGRVVPMTDKGAAC